MASAARELAPSPNTLLEEGFTPSLYISQHENLGVSEAADRYGGARSLPVFMASSCLESETETETETEGTVSDGATNGATRTVVHRHTPGEDNEHVYGRDNHS